MKELLSDQGTIMKKWSTILSDDETVEIGGAEFKLQVDECLVSLPELSDVQSRLMAGEIDNALHLIADLLIKIGFFTKNIQLGKQIYLQQNYAAQRVKNVAQRQQAIKNIELKMRQIQIVKKNYKGKTEMLKKHQDFPQYFE